MNLPGRYEMADAQRINLSDKTCVNLLHGLVISPWQPNIFQNDEESIEALLEQQMKDSLENLTVSTKMSCSLCGSSFQSRPQQTDHYKLDWHRFNLKQSIMGKPSVSAEVFETMTGEISSISGSDDDDNDEDVADPTTSNTNDSTTNQRNRDTKESSRRLPKVFFKNHQGQLVAVYRCLLQSKKEGLLTQSELVSRTTELPSNLHWAILMTAGGHFAAAIYNGSEIVHHKTFHRYTVRAKRGTAQGVRDGQQGGHAPRSAGAALRRYNEAQLQENVGSLLRSWKEELDKCSCIFIRAPSYNRSVIFSGKKALLDSHDKRIRTIPFPTRRPTLKEVQRVWSVLSSVEYFDDAEAAETKFLSPPASQKLKVDIKDEDSSRNDENETESLSISEEVETSAGVKFEKKEEKQAEGDDLGQSDGSDGSVELILEEVTSLTSHLRESDIFIPKQRRRRKKKTPTSKPETSLQDKQLRKIQTTMFTCCKTGDEDTFERKMSQLRQKITQDIEAEMEKTISQSKTISFDGIEDKTDGASLTGDSENMSETKQIFSAASVISDTSKNERIVSPCEQQASNFDLLQNVKREQEVNSRIESFLNEKLDASGNILLHVAAIEGHSILLWKLLCYGANPAIKNGKSLPPFAVSKNKTIRQDFRRFMGEFPDRFDYKTAQIPAPLSAEEEAIRINKAAEKRREQKKIKRQKQKEQKEEQQRVEEEEREQQIFAALSDREKRAIAAEKRLESQLISTNRCFSCATSLDGKVPFHYSDYNFCSMNCLKTHKQQQQL
ncbi:tRNA endonuclease ANKZF1-like isoform X2 [Apostichopus japonicus]|uniref:tRNA endonuclease ANKZF1-like isoform X2 n=1 Tax=Stichopus japonicus TaxID=307972 RepID=UPI003AB51765